METLDESNLPNDILEKIRELQLELNEGDITEKGFIKKKKLILQQHYGNRRTNQSLVENKGDHQSINQSDNRLLNFGINQSGRKKDGRKYTRDESRYRSVNCNDFELRNSYSGGDIREEAVREALAKHRGQEALVPSKRKEHSSSVGQGDNVLSGNASTAANVADGSINNNNSSVVGNISGNIILSTNLRGVDNQLQEQDSDTEDDDEDDENTTNATSSDGSNRRKSNRSTDLASASSLTQIASHKSPRVSRKDAAAATSNLVNIPRPQPRTRMGLNSNNNDGSGRSAKYQIGAHGAPPDVTSHAQQVMQQQQTSSLGLQQQQQPQQLQSQQQYSQQQQQQSHHQQYSRRQQYSEQPPSQSGSVTSLQGGVPAVGVSSCNSVGNIAPQVAAAAAMVVSGTGSTATSSSVTVPITATATTTSVSLSGVVSGTNISSNHVENGVVSSRVSEKIQQLVQTLKRPKRRPLPEYFQEDDDCVPTPCEDPSAPKPKGTIIEPAVGEPMNMQSGLPRSFEAALENYSQAHGKQSVLTCVDTTGRVSGSGLTYAKLYQKSIRIAYLLLNKVGHRGENSLKPRDRVALVFSNNDPTNLMCAFYGCLLAGVIPMTIEVPLAKRDASCQSMGFLLSSQEVRVVLTSEQCYKSLPRAPSGEIEALAGWPRVQWINIDHHSACKPNRDWRIPERLKESENLYIEYSYSPRDGSVRGVCVSREAALEHCRTLASVCGYQEGETLVCVSELKRETGLWHGMLTAVLTGMHVVFVPYAVLKVDPAVWLKQVTKLRASAAVVKSRDMHWALLAEREHGSINLSSLRALLVSDGSNPWSLNTCDNFLSTFQRRGLRSEVLCPCAGSSETLTLSIRRPSLTGPTVSVNSNGGNVAGSGLDLISTTTDNAGTGSSSVSNPGGRGVLSMHSLSYGLVRVDSENSLTSLTLQDCGQILPGGKAVVVKPHGVPYLCHTDEVGEVCLQADYTGSGYSRLTGQTNTYFKVQPLDSSDNPIESSGSGYVRSGLLGFLGPPRSGGLLFICGSVQGLMTVSGRRHNADDIIATVLAVEPMKLVFRGRIAVFSISLLRDERIVIVAELRFGYNEEAAFKWMSRVLQAVDSIHQVPVYSIALVQHNRLPKTPLGGIHVVDAKRRFLEGRLGACNVLLCPHNAITNLPQPRQPHQLAGHVGASAMMVGHLVQGARMGLAQGRAAPDQVQQQQQAIPISQIGFPGSSTIANILIDRANQNPTSRLLVQLGTRMQETSNFSCQQLLRRAERIAAQLVEKRKLTPGTPVLLVFPPGVELVAAVFACFLAGCLPIPVRPPTPSYSSGPLAATINPSSIGSSSIGLSSSSNTTSTISSNASHMLSNSASFLEAIITTVEYIRQVMQATKCTTVLTCQSVLKALRSREVAPKIQMGEWRLVIDTDDLPKKRLASQDYYRPSSLDEPAYLDFSCSAQGAPVGATISHSALLQICQAQKLQCEFYPSREVVLSLDPYSGLGFFLWCLAGVYCGHLSYLVPPHLLDSQPDLWLSACSAKQVRDTFCSYNTVEISTRCLANSIPILKQRGMQLSSLRSLVIVAEERPRVLTTNNFCKLFSVLGLNSRAVSTSFGSRVNVAMCLQGPSSPDTSSVYIDQISLRNDRVKLLEKGSPHSLCLLESGKLLPGVKIAIAHPDTQGQCADSHLGEIWVSSPFNSTNIITCGTITDPVTEAEVTGPVVSTDKLCNRLAAGDTEAVYARTGFLGFVRRTELTQSDGERHDALFVVGALENTIMLRGMRYHPIDIEGTVFRCHKSKIAECVVFTWSNLLVVVVELNGEDWEAVDLVHLVTAAVLEEHYLIVGVVVVVDRGTIHINSRGEKERVLLRELFVNDKLDPMYVSYNM